MAPAAPPSIDPIRSVTLIGTGLIGASLGLALRAAGVTAPITGFDPDLSGLEHAYNRGAIDVAVSTRGAALESARTADLVLLATPVLPILDWMRALAPLCGEHTLITDVGSTKVEIAGAATELFHQPGRARFLPGHPMAGKERGGAELAEATLFRGAKWLFTPVAPATAPEHHWRSTVTAMGALTQDLEPARHDELCAWVSHLPQFLSTALAAMLEQRFADDPQTLADLQAIGGRALRETTRLGASPYSMWRDVALTNTAAVAEALHALEQELAHLRDNLRTPELRDAFASANRFRSQRL